MFGRRLWFSKNGNNFTILRISFDKDIKDSHYNGGLWILGLVSVLCFTGSLICLALFSKDMTQKIRRFKNGK
jgi:hypothetical protein